MKKIEDGARYTVDIHTFICSGAYLKALNINLNP